MTPTTSWCLVAIFFILTIGWGAWREAHPEPYNEEPEGNSLGAYNYDPEAVLIDDHGFDGGWHDSEQCQYEYDMTSDFTGDEPCLLPVDKHVFTLAEWLDMVDHD